MTAHQDRRGLWHITQRDSAELQDILTRRDPFTLSSGNLRGHAPVHPIESMGQLPRDLHYSAANSLYTVYSYETPIVWFDAIGSMWFAPVGLQYSATSSRHFRLVTNALSHAYYSVISSARVIADHRRDPSRPPVRDRYGNRL